MAFLVVLESVTPAGRVAFILHDVFGYPFTEIARGTAESGYKAAGFISLSNRGTWPLTFLCHSGLGPRSMLSVSGLLRRSENKTSPLCSRRDWAKQYAVNFIFPTPKKSGDFRPKTCTPSKRADALPRIPPPDCSEKC
jgi:hypothetical protein